MSALPESNQPQSETEIISSCYERMGESIGRAALLRNDVLLAIRDLPEERRTKIASSVNRTLGLMQDAHYMVYDMLPVDNLRVLDTPLTRNEVGKDLISPDSEHRGTRDGEEQLDEAAEVVGELKSVVLNFAGVRVSSEDLGISLARDLEMMLLLPKLLDLDYFTRSNALSLGFYATASSNKVRGAAFLSSMKKVCASIQDRLGIIVISQTGERKGRKYIPQIQAGLEAAVYASDNQGAQWQSVRLSESRDSRLKGATQEEDLVDETLQAKDATPTSQSPATFKTVQVEVFKPEVSKELTDALKSYTSLRKRSGETRPITEWTPKILKMYFDEGMSMSEISQDDITPLVITPYGVKTLIREILKEIALNNNSPAVKRDAKLYLEYLDETG